MKQAELENAQQHASDIINRWLKETQGTPMTLQLVKLGFAVVEGLKAAYVAGYRAGLKADLPTSPERDSHVP